MLSLFLFRLSSFSGEESAQEKGEREEGEREGEEGEREGDELGSLSLDMCGQMWKLSSLYARRKIASRSLSQNGEVWTSTVKNVFKTPIVRDAASRRKTSR